MINGELVIEWIKEKSIKDVVVENNSLLVKYSEFGHNDDCISSGADC